MSSSTAAQVASTSLLQQIFEERETPLLNRWVALQHARVTRRDLLQDSALQQECATFVRELRRSISLAGSEAVDGIEFEGVRDFLRGVSASRARLGFSPTETAMFVFSLKEAVFEELRVLATDAAALAEESWLASQLLDRLGLVTIEAHQRTREEVIERQRAEMLELSTPVVKLWDGILALPLIGTLDSTRTQAVMESLLERIVAEGARIAIIDITGVPTVDTLTAQHLLKTVTATRLMGAECIISGIRPQIAQTIVHLGVDLGDVVTKSSLAGALDVALARMGRTITGRA